MIRVLVVAGYSSVRAGLSALLTGEPDLAVVGQLAGSDGLRNAIDELHPDVVLYDHAEHDCAAVLDTLSNRLPVVALGPPDSLRAWNRDAVFGWLSKSAEPPEIAAAIRAVVQGLAVLDGQAFVNLLQDPARSKVTQRHEPVPSEMLSARETEVLQLMAEGLPNKVIGARLGITASTAKFHVASILTKLGASSRTEAVSIGARDGLVTF